MGAIVKSEKDIESIEWIKLPFPGCTVRILGRNEETGACGVLFKMEPGAELPRHGVVEALKGMCQKKKPWFKKSEMHGDLPSNFRKV